MEDSLKLESAHQQYQSISGISRTGASVHQQQQLMLVLILLMLLNKDQDQLTDLSIAVCSCLMTLQWLN